MTHITQILGEIGWKRGMKGVPTTWWCGHCSTNWSASWRAHSERRAPPVEGAFELILSHFVALFGLISCDLSHCYARAPRPQKNCALTASHPPTSGGAQGAARHGGHGLQIELVGARIRPFAAFLEDLGRLRHAFRCVGGAVCCVSRGAPT